MALLLPRAVFYHVPKTGGQWVGQALKRVDLVEGSVGEVHASPEEVKTDRAVTSRPYSLAFVRHPLTWYRSMWAHRRDEKWGPIDDPDWFSPRWVAWWANFTERVQADEFSEYVERCVAAYPDGLLTELFTTYAEDCTHVGRFERLQNDLADFLCDLGLDPDVRTLHGTPERNVRGSTSRRQREARYTPALAKLVQQAEVEVLRRYGYEERAA